MLNLDSAAQQIPQLAKALPPFPRVVLDLLDMLRKDEFTLEALVHLARDDAVIAGNILSQANHIQRLRARADLADPFIAASIIGVNRIRHIAIATGMNRFIAAQHGDSFFYQHTQCVAIVAQELAALCDLSTEMAFVAGMMHDIGKLGLYVLDPQATVRASRRAEQGGDLLKHEVAEFGVDHCQLGALLAEHWALPADIVSGVRTHHDTATVASKLQAVVCLAESIAVALNLPPSPANQLCQVNNAAAEALGLDWGSMDMLDCYGRCRARCLALLKAAPALN